MDEDDAEIVLAMEASMKTYEDEQRQRGIGSDLIRFESPDEPARRKKINEIKQLYDSNLPGTSSYRGSAATTPTEFRPVYNDAQFSISSFANFPTYPQTHSDPWVPFQQQEVVPPRPPKPNQYKFPPQASFPLLYSENFQPPPPPPLPPRQSRVLQSPPVNIEPRQPISSTPLRHSAPSFTSPRQFLSPIKPFDVSFDSTTNSSQNTTANESSSNEHSVQYQPLTHLYVPYTMENLNSSYQDRLNGDLIDLSCVEESSIASQDEIRREFDPLYVSTYSTATPTTSMPAVQIFHVKPIDEPKCVADVKLKTENIEFPSSSFCLIECSNVIEEQVEKICRRGIIEKDMTPNFFIAPTVDYMTTTASSVKVLVSKDYSWKENNRKAKVLICDIDRTMDIITAQALSSFDSNLEENKEYGLKIYGLNQFLAKDSLLGSNLYTGHCLLNGEDVKLEVGVFEPQKRVYDHMVATWNSMRSQVRYATVVDKEDVENTFGHLASEMMHYEKAFNDGSTLKLSASSQRVKQVIMLLCKCLHGIVPEKLYNEMQKYLAATTEDQLAHHRNDFLREIHSFLEIYCKCTVSRYDLPPLQLLTKPKMTVLDKKKDYLQIMLNSVHSIPENWKRDYTEFHMSVDLYYGTQVLDGHSNRIPKNIKNDQFNSDQFARIPLDLYAKFTRLHLSQYPRETRIVVSVSGTLRNSVQSASENNAEIKILGYCSVPLYDENLFMRQGPLFLPLTLLKKEPTVVKPFGPYPYIKDARDPIVIISFKVWDTEIFFPHIEPEMQCIPQDFSTLDMETQEYLMEMIERQDPSRLEADDQELIWQKRLYLTHQPEALPLVLSSLQDWSVKPVTDVYQILEEWEPLRPEIAMELLLPQYPDEHVRAYAVKSLAQGSTDFLYHSIPQFIEALRFELYEKTALADFILELSFVSLDFTFEIYWQLQQRVDHCAVDDLPYAVRCQNLQQKIIDEHGNPNLKMDIKLQHDLINELDAIQDDVKSSSAEGEEKLQQLRFRMSLLDSQLLQKRVRLPICPAFDCTGIRIEECSIFNSNAKPLKVVFRGINTNYSIILKREDDMRQDAFVLKMVNEMDRIWKSNNLDLRMITFRIMPVGYKRGMGELVLNCETLREIQAEDGISGVFKDEVLREWLVKHNSDEFTYKEAHENFIRSCAGWCIVTYVLGIGDRHNDNILFTKNGHVFHIDFGKYMGDWQMAAGIRRDRVPFVFTKEMYYVINGGMSQTQYYQKFLDYCCTAFSLLRRNKNVLTSLLKIMGCSEISGINLESIAFVEKNLMLDLTETRAKSQFTEMINNSLNNSSVRLNFVVHTVAQIMSGGSSKKNHVFSFVEKMYTRETDGPLVSVVPITFEKHCIPNKVYMYKLKVTRQNVAVPSFIYRSFSEFEELHNKLKHRFPTMKTLLNTSSQMRSNVRAVALKRFGDVKIFLEALLKQSVEICHCDLVYTFFHSIHRDNKCDTYIDVGMPTRPCQVRLEIKYHSKEATLSVFIKDVKNLALLQTGQPPDAYVKTYVRPDLQNYSKRKTQIVRNTQHPSFYKEFTYDHFPPSLLSSRVLEVSIWHNGGLLENHKMYTVCIPLMKIERIKEDKSLRKLEGWFQCDKYI